MRSTGFSLGAATALALFLLPTHAVASADDLPFQTSILPILTRAGCNSAACHGAATGQAGFKLSLLGYDPEEDYQQITHELGARRIELDQPEESLLLRKASRQIEHEGGRRLARDSREYSILQRWIAAGTPYGPRDLRISRISVAPAEKLFPATNQSVQLRVTAFLSDGSQQDATDLTLFTSNDDAVAEVTKAGSVTTRSPGVTSIMVRYGGQVAAARVALPFGAREINPEAFTPFNFIDEHLLAEFKRLRLTPSPLSSDPEFLRRIYLDLLGRLPGPEETRAFLTQPATRAKREHLIDQLLEREEFVDLWTMHLEDLLLVSGKRGGAETLRAYHFWLRQQISSNTPLDQLTRTLLTATGDLRSSAPANFFSIANDPRDLAEQVGRIFMGTQIGCARCHAHPSDRWTREDYYGFAAFFAGIGHDGEVVKNNPQAQIRYPKDGHAVPPKLLGAFSSAAFVEDRDPRVDLAAWLTSPENPFFARALVNRAWKLLLGRGLVEPVDDLRPTNPATHPALLDAVAADFVRGGFDLRRLLKKITSSSAYQLTSATHPLNQADDRFFSHAFFKPLPAQVFLDAVSEVTGVRESFDAHPAETRAVQLIGSQVPSYALDVLGRCSREKTCDTRASAGGGLAQALHLINGATINSKLKGGLVDFLARPPMDSRRAIEELYLRALSRPPTTAESDAWSSLLTDTPNPREALEDLLWAVLNSREFAFNH